MPVSDRIKAIIKENGLKQKEFAKSLNVTESYISKLLRDDSGLSNSTATLIEEIYGYSSHWILTGEGEKHITPSKDKKLSPIKRKVLTDIENMTDDEIKAVMAFMKTFGNVKNEFPNTEKD